MVANISDSEIQLKDVLHLLWHKKGIIILVAGVCALIGFIYAIYTKPLYRASVILMPPLVSSVVPLNETDLKLFNAKNIFSIFTSFLKSEDMKYTFLKKNALPIQPASSSLAAQYKAFSKALKIDLVPGTSNYKITYTTANPSSIHMKIKKFIDYANQHALNEVIKTSKKEHENRALLIQREIDSLKLRATYQVKSQLAAVREALYIAESSGIENPLIFNKRLDRFGSDSMYLYYNGSKALRASIHNLSERTDYEAFIPNLDALIVKHDFYKNYQLTLRKNILYHLDGIEIPSTLITFSKALMTLIASLFGIILASMLVVFSDLFFKNGELHA